MAHRVVQVILEHAHAHKCLFSSLDLMGVLTLGRVKFIRFKVACPALQPILLTLDRAVVYQAGGQYCLKKTGEDRTYPVSILIMTSVPDPQLKRTYRGPAIKYWERQFV